MKFKGFPNLNWESVLKRPLIESHCTDTSKSLVRYFISCFYRGKGGGYQLIKGNSSKILFFQPYYSRNSYLEQVNNIVDHLKCDLIRGKKNETEKRLLSITFIFKFIIPWYKTIASSKLYPHLWLRFKILESVISLYDLNIYLKRFDIHNYNLLVTFCDSIIEEAFVTEFFKASEVKTATLQHGQFTAFRENTLVNSGVEIKSLKSDYFLVWNQMTIDECNKENIQAVDLVPCGILGYFGKKYEHSVNPQNRIFGVVINHQVFEKENLALIQSANTLASQIGYKYYLKLHPNYSPDYFDSYVDKNYYIGNIKKGIPILEYSNMCEFSLASSSSVFCELVYVRHNVLRLSTGEINDKFRDVPYGRTFSNSSDVVINYRKGFDQEEEQKLFEYLCETDAVTEKYMNFFHKFEE